MFHKLLRNYHRLILVNHQFVSFKIYSQQSLFISRNSSNFSSIINMADNSTSLEEQIKQQGDIVRSLKSQKADKEKVNL